MTSQSCSPTSSSSNGRSLFSSSSTTRTWARHRTCSGSFEPWVTVAWTCTRTQASPHAAPSCPETSTTNTLATAARATPTSAYGRDEPRQGDRPRPLLRGEGARARRAARSGDRDAERALLPRDRLSTLRRPLAHDPLRQARLPDRPLRRLQPRVREPTGRRVARARRVPCGRRARERSLGGRPHVGEAAAARPREDRKSVG